MNEINTLKEKIEHCKHLMRLEQSIIDRLEAKIKLLEQNIQDEKHKA